MSDPAPKSPPIDTFGAVAFSTEEECSWRVGHFVCHPKKTSAIERFFGPPLQGITAEAEMARYSVELCCSSDDLFETMKKALLFSASQIARDYALGCGFCPRHGIPLSRIKIGNTRTTAFFCADCDKYRSK